MCDDSALHRAPAGRPREAHERLRADELVPFGDASAGVVFFPDGPGPAPVLVVSPERYGLVQHTVDVAARFAREGWVAVSPDFYLGVAEDETARLPPLSDATVLRHVRAALDHVASDPRADTSRVGIFGVCRSGSWGLLAADADPAVRAVVMLYGGAAPKEWETGPLRPRPYSGIVAGSRAPVLGVFAERDHTMSLADVGRLRDLFEQHHRSYDISIVRAMPHGWLNDTMPGRFEADVAERTWAQMTQFLRVHLPPGRPASTPADVEWRFTATTAADYDFAHNTRLA